MAFAGKEKQCNAIRHPCLTSDSIQCFAITTQASVVLRTGLLPALKETNGIVVSLWGPDKIVSDDDSSLPFMGRLATSREAVLCIALPHHMLWPLSSVSAKAKAANAACEKLRLVPHDVMEAMTAFDFSSTGNSGVVKARKGQENHHDHSVHESSANRSSKDGSRASDLRASEGIRASQHHHQHLRKERILSLPSSCVLRAFQLKESASFPANGNAELLREGEADPLQAAVMGSSAPTQDIWQPRTCLEYAAAMNEVRARCEDEGMVPMSDFHEKT